MRRVLLARLLPVLVGLLAPSCLVGADADELACTDVHALELYERRIEPLLREDRPKSCNQCHLSGVDLSLFVRPDPCQTIGCLMQLDLVDLEHPDQSVILAWIARAKPDSELITDQVISEEYSGFKEWIEYQARCGREVCGEVSCPPLAAPDACEVTPEPFGEPDLADPGGCDDLSLERLFADTVYRWRGRCSPCHVEGAFNRKEEAPAWVRTTGGCNSASLATLREVVNGGLVRTDDPLRSKLLLKPLAESAGGVQHGGHDKFTGPGDPAYDAFVRWLERYAECSQ